MRDLGCCKKIMRDTWILHKNNARYLDIARKMRDTRILHEKREILGCCTKMRDTWILHENCEILGYCKKHARYLDVAQKS